MSRFGLKRIARVVTRLGLYLQGNRLVKYYRRLTLLGQMIVVFVVTFGWVFIAVYPKVHAAPTHMLLFWDSPTPPSDTNWSDVTSTYNNRFPRGDTIANFGTTGGNASRTPTVATETMTINDPNPMGTANSTPQIPTSGHTHANPTTSMSSISNLPAYCNLRVIRYDPGIPNVIPAGAIAIFDSTPGIPPSGWTRMSNMDNRMARISTSSTSCTTSPLVSDGGSDTHTNTVMWNGGSGTLGTVTGGIDDRAGCTRLLGLCGDAATNSHSHSFPTSTSVNNITSIPRYVTPLLAKASANTPTISIGFSAMFDGDPGGGWVLQSDTGGDFNGNLLRPASSYNATPQGNVTFAEPNLAATSGTPTGGTQDTLSILDNNQAASSAHTHTVTLTFNAVNIMPPYVNMVIAEKVNFILTDFRWYADNTTSEDVTDPWSSLDTPQNAKIDTLPVANAPPSDQQQLRLRMRILINGNNLAANVAQFKLQYKATTSNDCTTSGWTDVDTSGTGSAIWRYGTSSISDGATLSNSRLSPASTWPELYIKSAASGTNPSSAIISETIEYDFHIQHNGAVGATEYHFRMLESNGTLLSEYDVCPGLVTKPTVDQLLRGGNFFQDNSKKGFFWAD